MDTFLLFPHQLFDALACQKAILVEDRLFFSQYSFHKQKLVFHRASMKAFEARLMDRGVKVHYLEHREYGNLEAVFDFLLRNKIRRVHVYDPCDYLLSRRLHRIALRTQIELIVVQTPGFMLSDTEARSSLGEKKHYLMASFYAAQRKRFKVLVDQHGNPEGGKWSFDTENRKKAPASLVIPPPPSFSSSYSQEAIAYVEKYFPGHYGQSAPFHYPTTHPQAQEQLAFFIQSKLRYFGDYEDAMLIGEPLLYHSQLTPALNSGLLTPREVLDAAMHEHQKAELPLNSLEGFVRQIIGWREFMRGIYIQKGTQQRLSNHWQHKNMIPKSFYEGSTGIIPVDDCIRKLLKTGYLHHIERLMVLGSFMLLCEFDPEEVYRWFMELFIDAYDWVMVPNVYGMSQYADAGLITTKPYICGSNYIQKMSNYPKGEWCEIWDGLYWRFIYQHVDSFASNPRMSMMAVSVRKMKPEVLMRHLDKAEAFLHKIRSPRSAIKA